MILALLYLLGFVLLDLVAILLAIRLDASFKPALVGVPV